MAVLSVWIKKNPPKNPYIYRPLKEGKRDKKQDSKREKRLHQKLKMNDQLKNPRLRLILIHNNTCFGLERL